MSLYCFTLLKNYKVVSDSQCVPLYTCHVCKPTTFVYYFVPSETTLDQLVTHCIICITECSKNSTESMDTSYITNTATRIQSLLGLWLLFLNASGSGVIQPSESRTISFSIKMRQTMQMATTQCWDLIFAKPHLFAIYNKSICHVIQSSSHIPSP